MKVKDFMIGNVVTVSKGMTVEEFIHVLEDNEISGAPVTDNQNHILGVLSVSDIIRHSKYMNNELANLHEGDQTAPCLNMVNVHKYHTTELFESLIDGLIAPSFASVKSDDDLQKAIDVFLETTAHRLLVIDDDFLVGVITIKDAMRAFVSNSTDAA